MEDIIASQPIASAKSRRKTVIDKCITNKRRRRMSSSTQEDKNSSTGYITTVHHSGHQLSYSLLYRKSFVLWVADLCSTFQLDQSTFFLAITLLDRISDHGRSTIHDNTREQTMRSFCCCAIAAKFQEGTILPFSHLSTSGITSNDLVTYEQATLTLLGFSVFVPTLYSALMAQCKYLDLHLDTVEAAEMIARRLVLERNTGSLPVYQLAAICIFCAAHHSKQSVSISRLLEVAGCTDFSELWPCFEMVQELQPICPSGDYKHLF